MLVDSRSEIYKYLYDMFYDVVTKNVYCVNEPQELKEDDIKNGFVVIKVGDIIDESQFDGEAYGYTRCYIEAYIPPISRGRLDYDKFKEFEDGINGVIKNATKEIGNNSDYFIEQGSELSMDSQQTNNANNIFFMFIKSFVIIIDKQSSN